MNQTERLYKIEQLMADKRVVPLQVFLERLEISRANFKRDIEYLRSRLNAPAVWDRLAGGYRFEQGTGASRAGPKHELPGLWFNAGDAGRQAPVHARACALGGA